ncbi:MAG: anthranilate synthase component I family protein, partial [Frankiales bacterium]|nr:anthranilate synthase component I family protein [Frankiales bacterium]
MRPPGTPPAWRGPLVERERWEWRDGDPGDPAVLLADFLSAHGLDGEPAGQRGDTVVALLAGAVGCARLAGLPPGRPSPVPAVPEVVAVAFATGGGQAAAAARGVVSGGGVSGWTLSWTDDQHAEAIEVVRPASGRGEVYQANVVGQRAAPHRADPRALAAT